MVFVLGTLLSLVTTDSLYVKVIHKSREAVFVSFWICL